jgi:hypothetical protein
MEEYMQSKKEASHLKKTEVRKTKEVKDKNLEKVGAAKKEKVETLGHKVTDAEAYNVSSLQSADNNLLGFAGGEIGGGDDDRRRGGKGGRRDRDERPRGDKKHQQGKNLVFAEEEFPSL